MAGPDRSEATMELRKIQVTGGASYTVTLPKEWVHQSKLAAGDVVGFSPHPDGSLGVYPHARLGTSRSRHELELAGEDTDAAFRNIVAAYVNGFDVIVLRSRKPVSPGVRRAVRKATRRIVGLQVVEEEANAIVLQDFMDPKEFHIDKALRRMHALARSMQEDALRAVNAPLPDMESFEERDDEIDSLYWMVNKQYHAILRDPSYAQKMGLNANQALNYLMCARLIERVADHAARVAANVTAMHADEVGSKLALRIEKQAKKAVQLFSDAMASFHKRDDVAANRIIAEAETFRGAQESTLKESLSLGGGAIVHVAYALESIGRTAAYAADVAETALNHRVIMGK